MVLPKALGDTVAEVVLTAGIEAGILKQQMIEPNPGR